MNNVLDFNKIESIRAAKKITIKELCARAKFTPDAYHKMKQNGNPTIATIKKLSDALNVHPCQFFSENEHPDTNIEAKNCPNKTTNPTITENLLKSKDQTISVLMKNANLLAKSMELQQKQIIKLENTIENLKKKGNKNKKARSNKEQNNTSP